MLNIETYIMLNIEIFIVLYNFRLFSIYLSSKYIMLIYSICSNIDK